MFDLDQPPPAPPHRGAKWMVTLVDLVSLLVSFFVLVYAGALLPAGSLPVRGIFSAPPAQPKTPPPAEGEGTDPAYLAAVLGPAIATDPALGGRDGGSGYGSGDGGHQGAVSVAAIGDRLVLELPSKRVFYPHLGTITPEARAMLTAILPHLARLRLPEIVAVETDGTDAGRRLAIRRGRAVRAGLRTLGVAQDAGVFAIPAVASSRPQGACAAAAALGDRRSVVVCLSGGG